MNKLLYIGTLAMAIIGYTDFSYALPKSQGYAKCSCVCASNNGQDEHSTSDIAAPSGDITACGKFEGADCSKISGQKGSTLKECEGYVSPTPYKFNRLPSGILAPVRPETLKPN